EALADELRDRRVVGDALAEFAGREALHPVDVADDRRAVETELRGQRRDRLRRRALAEHHLGGVARQDVEDREDDDRCRQERQQQAREALEQEEADGRGSARRLDRLLMMAQSRACGGRSRWPLPPTPFRSRPTASWSAASGAPPARRSRSRILRTAASSRASRAAALPRSTPPSPRRASRSTAATPVPGGAWRRSTAGAS